jgi:choline dehydrogenase-like flavoprotein
MNAPVVIVGGGTAGCTVASHLAAHTQRAIVVCEPGRPSTHDDHPAFFDVIADASLTVAESIRLSSSRITHDYLRARAVGGGSAVNAMLLTGDEPDHLRGLTRLSDDADMGLLSRALLACGGEPSRLWWNGGRWNPGRALVHLVEEGRVEICSGSVSHIELDNRRVVAVWCGDRRIETDLVVLAAGALESPRILLRSGCGEFVRGIGEGLQDHPCITFMLPLRHENPATFDATVVKRIDAGNGAKGLLIAYERAGAGDRANGLLSAILMNPRSTGNMSTSGEVSLNLLHDDFDARAMAAIVRDACEVLSSEPFVAVCGNPVADDVGTSLGTISTMSDEVLADWIKGALEPVSHVSASLSRSVDEHGRVNGIAGLVVADASVLPGVPHETPAAPVTMEALRIARALGETLG